MTTRTRSDRIDAYRNLATEEIGAGHWIGRTTGGYDLYAFNSEWEPVCRHTDDNGVDFYVPTTRLQRDRDGHWYTRS